MTSSPSEIFRWLRPCVLSQRVQIKSIKQMTFLSKQTQNSWKFVTAIVRGGGCKLWRYISRGVKYLWRNVTSGGGGRFLPKIVWRHLWTAPVQQEQSSIFISCCAGACAQWLHDVLINLWECDKAAGWWRTAVAGLRDNYMPMCSQRDVWPFTIYAFRTESFALDKS